jgi:hypothetical protein
VLITRCAWHRGYHGHPAFIGVTDWRGVRLGFSDGICSQCAAQLRADIPGTPLTNRRSTTDVAGWIPGLGLVTIAVMAIVLFAARPVHEPAEEQWIAELVATEQAPPAADGDLARAADRRTVRFAAARAVDPRSGHAVDRHVYPRWTAPARAPVTREVTALGHAPSQSP